MNRYIIVFVMIIDIVGSIDTVIMVSVCRESNLVLYRQGTQLKFWTPNVMFIAYM